MIPITDYRADNPHYGTRQFASSPENEGDVLQGGTLKAMSAYRALMGLAAVRMRGPHDCAPGKSMEW